MGKIIIVTAGPTNERIDAVRHVTNMSTGSLGATIAEKFCYFDHHHPGSVDKVYYLSAKMTHKPKPTSKIHYVNFTDAENLLKKLASLLTNPDEHIDAVVHAAAVGDYKTRHAIRAEDLADELANAVMTMPHGIGRHMDEKTVRESILGILTHPKYALDANAKISSYEPNLMAAFDRTPKVISGIKKLSPTTQLVAFKLLKGVTKPELFAVASDLRKTNDADYVVANDLADITNERHPAMIIGHDSIAERDAIFIECETKDEIATTVVDLILHDEGKSYQVATDRTNTP